MIGKSIKNKTKTNKQKQQKENTQKNKGKAFQAILAAKKQGCCQKKFEKGWEVALYFSTLIHFSQRISLFASF